MRRVIPILITLTVVLSITGCAQVNKLMGKEDSSELDSVVTTDEDDPWANYEGLDEEGEAFLEESGEQEQATESTEQSAENTGFTDIPVETTSDAPDGLNDILFANAVGLEAYKLLQEKGYTVTAEFEDASLTEQNGSAGELFEVLSLNDVATYSSYLVKSFEVEGFDVQMLIYKSEDMTTVPTTEAEEVEIDSTPAPTPEATPTPTPAPEENLTEVVDKKTEDLRDKVKFILGED